VMGICLRYSASEDDAHVMVQESFFRVFKSLKNFKESEQPLDVWVKQNVIQASIKYIRDDKTERSIVSTIHVNKMGKDKPEEMSDTDIVTKAKQEDMLKAIQELTPGYRIVFNLFLMDGYTYEEIGEMLDVSEYTSKTNFEKARYSFRKNLIQHLSNSNGK
jgi:RNA polymerase sigma factor (sigma-70 family)